MTERGQRLDVISELAPMRRYALSLTRDPDLADDLVQDTLVKAIERRGQFRAGRDLRSWLLSILHNAFVDGRRSGRVRERYAAELARHAIDISPPPQDEAVRFRQVRDAFAALPEDQRAALHLVAVEGLSYDDAAAALAIPVGTLVSRISRARARLRAFEEGEAATNVVPLRVAGGTIDAG